MIRAALRAVGIVGLACLALTLAALWLGSRNRDDVIAYALQPSISFSDIYLLDLRTSAQINLTHAQNSYNTYPAWSPDGSRLAYFQTLRGENGSSSTAICVFDGATRCYISGADNGVSLVWSPDGQSITYRGAFDTFDTLDIASGAIQTADLGDRPTFWAWSPDGSQFVVAICSAMSEETGGDCTVDLAQPDLSGMHFVYRGSLSMSMPVWSPDGTQIVFAASDLTNSSSIYLLDAASGSARRIAQFVGDDPTWSPNGTQIAYTAVGTNGRRQMYLIDLDGGSPRALSKVGEWQELLYAWSPDGSRILFRGTQTSGSDQLFVLDLASNTVEDIPSGAGRKTQFAWQP